MPGLSPTYHELIDQYNLTTHPKSGTILHFEGVGERDIYNPTVIEDHGKHYIAARVESRTSNWMVPEMYDPEVIFFEKQQFGPWRQVQGAASFKQMEDPFLIWVHENGTRQLVLGGVVVLDRSGSLPTIGTVFYKGKDIFSFEKEPFATIPDMKDIKLIERINKKEIVVTTRPLVAGWQTGRIGITKIQTLADLNSKAIWDACIDYNQVAQGSWIGANRLYLLHNPHTRHERIGVLGHIATVDEDGTQHYAAMTFTFDPDDPCDQDLPEAIPKVLATRAEFEDGPTKEESLKDVVFPAALEHTENGMTKLYAGLSDCRIGCVLVKDPFSNS